MYSIAVLQLCRVVWEIIPTSILHTCRGRLEQMKMHKNHLFQRNNGGGTDNYTHGCKHQCPWVEVVLPLGKSAATTFQVDNSSNSTGHNVNNRMFETIKVNGIPTRLHLPGGAINKIETERNVTLAKRTRNHKSGLAQEMVFQ